LQSSQKSFSAKYCGSALKIVQATQNYKLCSATFSASLSMTEKSGMNKSLCGRTLAQITFLLAKVIAPVGTDMHKSFSELAHIGEDNRDSV